MREEPAAQALVSYEVYRGYALGTFNRLVLMVDDLLRANLLDDVPNGHPYIAFAILAGVRLRRLAPTAIEQRDARCDARGLALAALGYATQHAQAQLSLRTRQTADIRKCSSHLSRLTPSVSIAPAPSPDQPAPPDCPPATW